MVRAPGRVCPYPAQAVRRGPARERSGGHPSRAGRRGTHMGVVAHDASRTTADVPYIALERQRIQNLAAVG